MKQLLAALSLIVVLAAPTCANACHGRTLPATSYPGVSPSPPCIDLAYSSFLQADNVRIAAAAALRPRDLQPDMPFHLGSAAAGVAPRPLGGLLVGTYSYEHGQYQFQPVITGSWADGSANRSLFAALVGLGLVSDQTTQ